MEQRGWSEADVVLFSADAYVDHPSFGAAVIGRVLEDAGWRVAIVPQPDWHGDFRDFRKLGRPRLFFGVAPGCMDSMVNKYTANKRLRSEDAYSPDGRHDLRPEYPTVVYTQILKQLFPDVPVVLGGIEASMRRLTHYDYWQNRLRRSILCDSGADLLIYGMGELPVTDLCRLLDHKLLHGRDEARVDAADFRQLLRKYPLRQTVTLEREADIHSGIGPTDIVLHSHEAALAAVLPAGAALSEQERQKDTKSSETSESADTRNKLQYVFRGNDSAADCLGAWPCRKHGVRSSADIRQVRADHGGKHCAEGTSRGIAPISLNSSQTRTAFRSEGGRKS